MGNKSTSASHVIAKIRSAIAQFGIPELIVADNGPPFASAEFRDYCDRNGITLKHSPPYHPNSNGAAEAAVKSVKRAVFKVHRNDKNSIQERIDNFLFQNRNTPHSLTGLTPADLMLKFSPRTRLGMLKPDVAGKIKKSQESVCTKVNATDNLKPRKFGEHQPVWVWNTKGRVWLAGKIVSIVSTGTYMVQIGDREMFVHADHIRSRCSIEKDHWVHRRRDIDLFDHVKKQPQKVACPTSPTTCRGSPEKGTDTEPLRSIASNRPRRVIVKPDRLDL